ncbi:hypothetical protein [Roseiterribacter gracilis]|uniref:Uncharacterized protein n=1 Tax=Roseiterribacter gracilis TaxID=2812848 RepID=A0A8S8XAC2_9PROT|nr:hypothetical protein TMPK1_04070 [Rhodospirillales bacterium TMPK1]
MAFDFDQTLQAIGDAIVNQLRLDGKAAGDYALTGAKQIASTAAYIVANYAIGKIRPAMAEALFENQKDSVAILFEGVHGMTALAAENAINAGLAVARSAVNTATGLSL